MTMTSMTGRSSRMSWAIVLILAVLGMAACASPEPRYVSLVGPEAREQMGQCGRDSRMPPPWIDVQPIGVPERLNRTNLVVRTGDAVQILENDRWSAPLPDEFRDALSERLQDSLGGVAQAGREVVSSQERYRISVDIVQLDADPGQPIGAALNWHIRSVPDSRLRSGRSRVVLPAPGSVRGMVQAYQRIVSSVAEDLCAALSKMQ